jgi:Group II intron, maturase-specific domain
MGKSRKDGRWYLLKWPSARAMAQIRAKIREQTGRNRARLPLEWAVENINHVVRGWGNYFRYGNSAAKFSAIDSYVNERLAILASTKHGLQGRSWMTHFNYEWATRIGVYRLSGTVRATLAFASDEHVGEPCAGKPHARFDAAAGGGAVPLAVRPKGPCASRRPYQAGAADPLVRVFLGRGGSAPAAVEPPDNSNPGAPRSSSISSPDLSR